MSKMTSAKDGSSIVVFSMLVAALLSELYRPASAQGLFFSETRNVDEILQANFGISTGGGGGLLTRTSPSNRASCSTPEQQQGQCLLLSQCSVYMPLVKNIRDPKVAVFLRDRICRLEVNNVRICCPNDPQKAVLPTSVSPTQSPSSRPSQGSFVQPQPSSQNLQPVRISFGGSGNNNPQSLPIAPTTLNRSTTPNLPPQPPQKVPFPTTTTTIPRTSTQGSSVTFFPNNQNRVPSTQDPQTQLPVFLPFLPPQIPSAQPSSSQGVDPTATPQTSVSFAPSALLPDRISNQQPQKPLTPVSSPSGVPVNAIPSESECGSSVRLKNLRSNKLPNWPWLAAVGYSQDGGKFEVMCGGAVITRRHIITAAHCIRNNRFANGIPTHVRVGDYDLSRSNDVASPQNIRIATHQTPGHDANTFEKDIAVITLADSIVFNDFIQPICLPYRFKYDGFRYQNLSVIGWRDTLLIKGRKDLPQTPNPFDAPVLTLGECRRTYQQSSKSIIVDRRNLCIDGGSEDACLRDSGASAVYLDEDASNNYFLVGLGSFGFGCDRPNEPNVYTRIGDYLNWIEEVVLDGG